MNRKCRKAATAALLAVCLVSTGWLVRNLVGYRSGSDTYSQARQLLEAPAQTIRTEPAALPEAEDPASEKLWIPAPVTDEDPALTELETVNLQRLQQANADVLAWIRIPGTKVDYPVLQGEDNEFYLNHDWKGGRVNVGSIFLEHQNKPDFTDYNTIVYGHNIADGSMFGSLRNYQNQTYWEAHPYIYLALPDGVLRYEVFSAYTAEVDSLTYALRFQQSQIREDFLSMARDNSVIDTGIQPEPADRILTLSTCTGVGYSSRWVVHARLRMVEAPLP